MLELFYTSQGISNICTCALHTIERSNCTRKNTWPSKVSKLYTENHPLVQQKPVLNCRCSLKRKLLCQSQHFFFSSKFTQKVVPSLHKPTTRYMCTLLCSYTPGEWLRVCKIWSRSAGSRSTQRPFCTKSSMHGNSVIKTRWSLTTEIVNSSFHCMFT